MEESLISELIKKFRLTNPNDGSELTYKDVEGFSRLNGTNLKETLISICLMCELNNYVPLNTKERLKKYINK